MQSAVQLHNTFKNIYSINPKMRKNNLKVIRRSLKPYSKTEAKLCIKRQKFKSLFAESLLCQSFQISFCSQMLH